MVDIIQASNQQFLGVLIMNVSLLAANLWIHNMDFSLSAFSPVAAAISCIFVAPSMLMGFAYLMLFTSTYEHTNSYEEAYSVCNNLALSSAVTSFVGAVFTLMALASHLFIASNHLIASVMCISVSCGIVYITKVSLEWGKAISTTKTTSSVQGK